MNTREIHGRNSFSFARQRTSTGRAGDHGKEEESASFHLPRGLRALTGTEAQFESGP